MACRSSAAARRRSNLAIAAIREHLAAKGLGLHNDLQDESSIVGNFPIIPIAQRLRHRGAEAVHRGHHHAEEPSGLRADRARPWQRRDLAGDHGRARRRRLGHQRRQALQQPGLPAPTPIWFSRAPPARRARRKGITAFIVPIDTPGHDDPLQSLDLQHAERPRGGRLRRTCACPTAPSCYKEGEGLMVAQRFVHENRIRQAAASAGAARYCIAAGGRIRQGAQGLRRAAVDEAGDPVSAGRAARRMRDGAQLHLQAPPGRWTAAIRMEISDKVSICNFRANRLACEAADRAMQVHGGMGYTPRAAVRAHLPPSPPLPHHRGLARRCRSGASRNICSASAASRQR